MTNQLKRLVLTLGLLSTLTSITFAQGTAFTYQGRLGVDGALAQGIYDLRFTVCDAASAGATVGSPFNTNGVPASNGLFTVTLDFGTGVFIGPARWLEIAVRTNGGSDFSLLSPRQKLTPTPYALYAPQAGTATTAFGVTAEAVGASGLQSSSVNSDKIADGSITAADVNSASFSSTFWRVNGNGWANPTNGAFLGTTDNLPVEFKVSGARALRLEPIAPGVISSLSAPNVIGGWAGNQVANGAIGATVWGGGFGLVDDYGNIVGADFGTVSGGRQNTADGAEATVAGGRANTASGLNSTVSGGYANAVTGSYATIAGGVGNTGGGQVATVGGGEVNTIKAADYATIGGGSQNTIQPDAHITTIGGGAYNTISSNAWRGTVGGGNANTAGAPEGTVAGGAFNSALAFAATVGGGGNNAASGGWSTIAGGRDNVLTNADYAAIGGGAQNVIQTNSPFATIGGGGLNVVRSDAWRGTVGGGFANTSGAPEGTVAGGAFNSALGFSATIGGGGGNTASGEWSTIAGGRDNLLTNANYATIGGGLQNVIQSNGFAATIPGGWLNSAADFAFAAGHRAKANHTGAFVWADATDADVASTRTNQFLVRASGGVRLETSGAGVTIDGLGVLAGSVNGSQITDGAVTTATIADGTVGLVDLSPTVASNSFWRLGGNAGTTPGSQFLGTMDNQPLEFKVWGLRALRLESSGNSPNVIGGHSLNLVTNGIIGATIAGGGSSDSPNRVGGDYATVLGGSGNTAIGRASTVMGFNTTARGSFSTAAGADTIAGGITSVAMGNTTTASGDRSVALGGQTTASGYSATALGGGTTASGDWATALGSGTIASGERSTALGFGTLASGGYSTAMGYGSSTPGFGATAMGRQTVAAGDYSFAAGYNAKANHHGSFVWADSIGSDFASTDMNQFVIRASSGVGLGTGNPQAPLHLYSGNAVTTFRLQSGAAPGFGRIEFVSDPQGSESEWRPGYIQSADNGGFTGGLSFVVNGTGFDNRFGEVETMRVVNGRVGIGTATPVSALEVVGTVTATAFNPPSDRNLKENFAPVNPREVLEKVAALPISRWNFKGDETTPHVGPMAQDFHAAFGLGTDERHIATVDADGVALAAIQGLNEKMEAENAALKERVKKLEKLLQKLANQ